MFRKNAILLRENTIVFRANEILFFRGDEISEGI